MSAPPAVLPMEPGAESGWLKSVETSINSAFEPIQKTATDIIMYAVPIGDAELPLIVVWLIVGALVFTVWSGFVQLRGLKVAKEVVKGDYSTPDDPGEVTHFQALTSAVSGTVGLGNIAGVGVAVTLGGAGATFWMIVAGLLGMCTKFVECTLGVKYREVHEDGTVSGGPFSYLPVAFRRLGAVPAKVLTGMYAVLIFFFGVAGGNMFQSNQTFAQAQQVFGGEDGPLGSDGAALLFGIGLAIPVALVLLGGMRSIGKVTSKLVPGMAAIYVLACLFVIGANLGHVPEAFGAIFSGAFSPEGVTGGVIGVLIIGFQRSAFSNEAGVGSAAIAHSAVKTRRPVSEGFVALLEPLIDTVIICTMTALTIIIANPASYGKARDEVAKTGESGADGVVLTSDAFNSLIPGFEYVLALAVALFAFSTLLTWSYYGLKAWHYLFGRSRVGEAIYKVIFCFFTVVGAVLALGEVIAFADAMLFGCALINILGLYILFPVVKREMREYFADRRAGTLKELGDSDSDSDGRRTATV